MKLDYETPQIQKKMYLLTSISYHPSIFKKCTN